jgi:hypothetical protein
MSDYRDLDEAHWARAQGALIDFLNADLDLAFTWLKTAHIDIRDDPKGCEMALTKVRVALNGVRRLSKNVHSPVAVKEITSRADELETALSTFQP